APPGSSFTEKKHAFKNYKCAEHDRFFGVDLFRASNSTGTNFHHMRLNPFTHVHPAVLDSFLVEAGVVA
ncbi:unnamed protein product, partial [Laminaria digitata]